MEAKVGFEPTWTALQTVASPHSATSPLLGAFSRALVKRCAPRCPLNVLGRYCDAVKFRLMARTRLVAGNWKMHGSRSANRALLDAILKGLAKGDAQCAVCPPFPYLGDVAERLRGTPIAWGAQNVSEHAQGAYTGEVSAAT